MEVYITKFVETEMFSLFIKIGREVGYVVYTAMTVGIIALYDRKQPVCIPCNTVTVKIEHQN